MKQDTLLSLIIKIRTPYIEKRHRGILCITSKPEHCDVITHTVLSEYPTTICIGAHTTSAQQHLGFESDLVIINTHTGFDPDEIAAASGLVLGGGLLILLSPSLSTWSDWQDPFHQRIQVENHSSTLPCHFNRYSLNVLTQNPHFHHYSFRPQELNSRPKTASQSEYKHVSEHTHRLVIKATKEQDLVINHLLKTRTKSCLNGILTARRGRGKSTLLALLLFAINEQRSNETIAITAPRKKATQSLFKQLSQLLQCSNQLKEINIKTHYRLEFISPDKLASCGKPYDLIIADEAAGIDIGLLQKITSTYQHWILSTTEQGYEGTANGFKTKRQQLWHTALHFELHRPLRFAANDPLEALIDQWLMPSETSRIKIQYATKKTLTAKKTIRLLTPEQLIQNPTLLAAVFSLLSDAHYETRPIDLRHILDGLNLSTWVYYYNQNIIACALVAKEGELKASLANLIHQGKRRPKGHLLPQVLTYQQGHKNACDYRYWRIVRIATHKTHQSKGIGSDFIHSLKQEAVKQQIDFIGASFSGHPRVMNFWSNNQFSTVHTGVNQAATTGAHSMTVLQPLSECATMALCNWQTHFQRQLPYLKKELQNQLTLPFWSLLSANTPTIAAMSDAERVRRLTDFADNIRGYELSLAALHEWYQRTESSKDSLLEEKLIHAKKWRDVAQQFKLTGRKSIEAQIRQKIKLALKQYHSDSG